MTVPSTRRIASLIKREHPLAHAATQRHRLSTIALEPSFDERVALAGHRPLRAHSIDVLQINVGKRCNQTCRHCHVDAGPERVEVMPDRVVDACLAVLERHNVPTLDITGGAPELHPRFREIVLRARGLGCRVIDRCNLTVTRLPNYADIPSFLAENGVEVYASLPWYRASQTDAQRGEGVFEESIEALRVFNALGYGMEGSDKVLNLVTNPAGAFLPASQSALERDWKRVLARQYGVHFHRLFALANMPVSRFLEFLEASEQTDAYVQKLAKSFNPNAVNGLMCRSMLSVGWDGVLYDCDFNQMLEMPLDATILSADWEPLATREVRTGAHCFGCTAGAGSSCGGATSG